MPFDKVKDFNLLSPYFSNFGVKDKNFIKYKIKFIGLTKSLVCWLSALYVEVNSVLSHNNNVMYLIRSSPMMILWNFDNGNIGYQKEFCSRFFSQLFPNIKIQRIKDSFSFA